LAPQAVAKVRRAWLRLAAFARIEGKGEY